MRKAIVTLLALALALAALPMPALNKGGGSQESTSSTVRISVPGVIQISVSPSEYEITVEPEDFPGPKTVYSEPGTLKVGSNIEGTLTVSSKCEEAPPEIIEHMVIQVGESDYPINSWSYSFQIPNEVEIGFKFGLKVDWKLTPYDGTATVIFTAVAETG